MGITIISILFVSGVALLGVYRWAKKRHKERKENEKLFKD